MLTEVARLLCERYNVEALDGPLKAAIDAEDVHALRALLADRELYRWREPIEAALTELAASPSSPAVGASEESTLATSSDAQPDTEAETGEEPKPRGRRRSE